ncbi:MAG: hypothetical protein RLZZ314_264 [Bacteroidota bacterium]|jgi:uncharacterized protein (DUF1015 family)|nr:DUF1015 family protein [Bacteroidota bacterium]
MTKARALMVPLAAVTPPRHMAHLVASRSYLSYTRAELQDKLKHNPYSYIQVINPDASREVEVPRGTPEFFKEVRAGYDDFKARGWLVDAEELEWLVYRQSTDVHAWTGVVCNLDLERCGTGGLRTHEQTLETRESLFASFLEAVGFHAEPILVACPDDALGASESMACLQDVVAQRPHTDFMTADGVRHELWRIPAHGESGQAFGQAWSQAEVLYLADGHHRLASSQRLASARPDLPGAGLILAYVVPQRDLTIQGYHKEIKDVQMSADALGKALERCPNAAVVGGDSASNDVTLPDSPGEIVVEYQGVVWRIRRTSESPEATDADWVQHHLIRDVFGIVDARNDARLNHLPEAQRPEGGWRVRAAQHPNRALVLLHAIPFDQIRDVADAQGTLPPKSTWVEPKIRSALFIHEFDPSQ